MKVITGKVRINYPNLFIPKKVEYSDESRYSVCILIPKNDIETMEKINEAIFKSKEKGLSVWGDIPENIKTPLRDGDLEKPGNEAYQNHYFVNTTNKYKPGIVNNLVKEIKNPEEIYPGCYCRASIEFYPFYKNNQCGIGCSIKNLQKISDGESILMSSRPEDDFTIIDGDQI
ncbi:DUF2815 family protein [Romboutsia sp.]|uniref:DUF2815 family protein n=1 Tax=Romboutsia sp. TaxID=1965302 RepID=UPI003F3D9BDD